MRALASTGASIGPVTRGASTFIGSATRRPRSSEASAATICPTCRLTVEDAAGAGADQHRLQSPQHDGRLAVRPSTVLAIRADRRLEGRLVVGRPGGHVLSEEAELEPAEAAQRAEPVAGVAGGFGGGGPVLLEVDGGRLQLEYVPCGCEPDGRSEARLRRGAARSRVASAVDRPPTLTPSTRTPRARVSGEPAYTIASAIATSTNRSTAANEIRLIRRARACRRRRMVVLGVGDFRLETQGSSLY